MTIEIIYSLFAQAWVLYINNVDCGHFSTYEEAEKYLINM
jgi:hypothetical protein